MSHSADALALSHYLSVIRRGWWIIALTAIVTTSIGVYMSRGQDTTYKASAAVFLGARNSAFLFSGIPEPFIDPERYLQNQANIARLPAVAELAVTDIGVPGYTVGRLLGGASVTPAVDADLLEFSVSDPDPSVAAEAATSYARAYTRYKQLVDTRTLAQTRSRYEQLITELEEEGGRGSARYRELVAQYEKLRTLELLQSSSNLTIRAATGAAAGSGPQPVRNATLALMFGLVLGVGLAFARDALNTRIRSEAEVEERLRLPLLGRIPEPPRSLRRKDRLVMLDDPRSPDAEAFRILATNVELVNLDHGARTIVVTSALRGEGKSTTVANLAVAFARAGRRVVLVDLDLRRSSLARFFVAKNEPAIGTPGLTHVVLGRATLEQALLPVPIDDAVFQFDPSSNGGRAGVLELLQTGPVTPNPAEFIVSHTLEDVLSQLAERADVVLIDAAPLLNVSDTVALSSKVDALIVVVHSGSTRRPVLGELQRVLDSARAVKLGFVFSGVSGDEAFGSAYGSTSQPTRTRVGQRTVA